MYVYGKIWFWIFNIRTPKFDSIKPCFGLNPPQRFLSESDAGDNLSTGRASQAGKVEGEYWS